MNNRNILNYISKRQYKLLVKELEESCDFSDYNQGDYGIKSYGESHPLRVVFLIFEGEKEYVLNRRRWEHTIVIIEDWLRGLPSSINIPFMYHEIDEFLNRFKVGFRNQYNRYDNYYKLIASIIYEEAIKVRR